MRVIQPIPKPSLQTSPGSLALPLATLKSYLRIDATTEDTMLTLILKSAVERVEKEIARKLISQTWDIFFDSFPCAYKEQWWDGERDGAISELYGEGGHLDLPFGPLTNVIGFFTYDDDGVEYEFDSTNYVIDANAPSGRVSLKSGAVWPATVLRATNGIKVKATFGYGTSSSNVPNDIQMAVMTLAARMYEHRGDELPELPKQVRTLLAPYEQIRI